MRRTIEQYSPPTLLSDLARNGRPQWDALHTKLAVAHVKQAIASWDCQEYELDKKVLVLAAYGLNLGYIDLMSQHKGSVQAVRADETEHMRLGARAMSIFLHDRPMFNSLSDDQKYWVPQLIFMHDRVDELIAPEELILMEAATLASFDPVITQATTSEQRALWQPTDLHARAERFITDYAKVKLTELTGVMPRSADLEAVISS